MKMNVRDVFTFLGKALRFCLGVVLICSASLFCGVLLVYFPKLLFAVLTMCTTAVAIVAVTVFTYARISATVCRVVITLSAATCLLCFSLFCLQFALLLIPENAMLYAFNDRARFPITNIGGIAVDSHGSIYLALQGYHRIQVYDADGRFVRGWFVDRPGGGRMRVWYDEHIHVLETRSMRHYIFTTDGRLVEMETILSSEAFNVLWDRARRLQNDVTLSRGMELRNPILLPPEVITPAAYTSAPMPIVRDPYYLAYLRLSPILVAVLLLNVMMTAALYRKLHVQRLRTAEGKSS